MNPSRDIEKLFDKFGGDAGNYQEIGRENEAVHARTRWPLLATLDLSQPSIPSIVPRREAHLPHTQDRSGEHRNVPNSLTQPEGAAPINRGKPPLFARAHRKTVPPVANVTLPAAPVGAERFSASSKRSKERRTPEKPRPCRQPLRNRSSQHVCRNRCSGRSTRSKSNTSRSRLSSTATAHATARHACERGRPTHGFCRRAATFEHCDEIAVVATRAGT
jgi:hypothetical protein